VACDWSRTPHARSLCIIVNFLTIAWGTQILGIDSHVRSYDRRTVSVEWSLRRANCKRFTHKRPTDGSVSRTVGCSLERRTQWRCMSDAHVQRSSVSKPFSQTSNFLCLWGGPEQNTLNTKHLNCQPLRSFCPRLRRQRTHPNVKRTPKNMRLTSHRRAESRAAQVRLQLYFAFRGAVHLNPCALEFDASP
jgi:hypothetical protein